MTTLRKLQFSSVYYTVIGFAALNYTFMSDAGLPILHSVLIYAAALGCIGIGGEKWRAAAGNAKQ